MSNNTISVGALKEFWKTKKFEKVKKYSSRAEVEEKVREIATTYHDEMTPLESDGTKDYKPEIEFLNYLSSEDNSGWELAFRSMALVNFEDSISETFNIDGIPEEYWYHHDYNKNFHYLIVTICEELNITQ